MAGRGLQMRPMNMGLVCALVCCGGVMVDDWAVRDLQRSQSSVMLLWSMLLCQFFDPRWSQINDGEKIGEKIVLVWVRKAKR